MPIMSGEHNKYEVVRSNKLVLLDQSSSIQFTQFSCPFKLQNMTNVYIKGFSKISMATSHLNH